MERASKSVKSIFVAMTQNGERSSLFWWFVENHDEFAEAAKRQRVQWSIFVERATILGLTNSGGVAPSRQNAKLTWHRAKAYVVRLRSVESQSASHRVPASQMPRDPTARPLPVASAPAYPRDSPISRQEGGLPDACPLPTPLSPTDTGSQVSAPNLTNLPATGRPLQLHQSQTSTDVALRQVDDIDGDWTPEQVAHLNATLARARAQLDHSDRFLKLQD